MTLILVLTMEGLISLDSPAQLGFQLGASANSPQTAPISSMAAESKVEQFTLQRKVAVAGAPVKTWWGWMATLTFEESLDFKWRATQFQTVNIFM